MKQSQHRTTEEIFAQMHQQLRSFDPEIPQSPDRLDPLLQILLRLYADQISQIDQRLDRTWQEATRELIKAVAPEGKRWPLPAYTVMRCVPNDPVVDVDGHVRFFYKERREGGQTLFFSPMREYRLLAAEARVLLIQQGERLIDMLPSDSEQGPVTSEFTTLNPEQPVTIWAGFEYEGPPSALSESRIFVHADHDSAKQIWWGRWAFGDRDGEFADGRSFVPGAGERSGVSEDPFNNWGGLRADHDVFSSLRHRFVRLPEGPAREWKAGPPDADIEGILPASVHKKVDETDLYWLRIDLSERGDRSRLRSGLALYFDCVPVINQYELNLFKHTGGARVVEVELPESIASILEVTSVEDSANRRYIPAHQIVSDPDVRRYTPQRRGERMVLWFDFSGELTAPPDSLNISYAVTAGQAANAIEAGRINQLYESHPGLKEVSSILPTEGGAPARTDEQLVMEAALRLRSRDRALSFDEMRRWVSTYDPRINQVDCAKGVQQTEYGVRRCIVVRAEVDAEKFYSNAEIDLLRHRLERFLKSRAPVNAQFTVEVVAR